MLVADGIQLGRLSAFVRVQGSCHTKFLGLRDGLFEIDTIDLAEELAGEIFVYRRGLLDLPALVEKVAEVGDALVGLVAEFLLAREDALLKAHEAAARLEPAPIDV